MNDDYYKILEISKTASQGEIQSAYRKLARKYHPDLNQADPSAKEKFQKVQEAYDVLNNPEKRRVYDQFGVSPDQMGSAGGGGPHQWAYGSGGGGNPFGGFKTSGGKSAGGFDLNDILRMFGGGMGGMNGMGGAGAGMEDMDDMHDPFGGASRRPSRGTDMERKIQIPFATAILGGLVDLKIRRPDTLKEETIAVKIPVGIEDGKKIRLPGMGNPGASGGKRGNLMIAVQVDEHPNFRRKEQNLYVDVPVSLKEAVLGAKIDVPTPNGSVSVSVPAGSSSGTKLRLRGRGVPPHGNHKEPGDLFVELSVHLPKKWSSEDLELLKKLKSDSTENIRKDLKF